jgi:hypothetical protein
MCNTLLLRRPFLAEKGKGVPVTNSRAWPTDGFQRWTVMLKKVESLG